MPSKRERFSQEFKEQAVLRVIQSGESIASVARLLHINEGTLGNWVNIYRKAHPVAEEPLSLPERAKLAELEKEVRDLRQKAEFLGKAAAYFAQEYR